MYFRFFYLIDSQQFKKVKKVDVSGFFFTRLTLNNFGFGGAFFLTDRGTATRKDR